MRNWSSVQPKAAIKRLASRVVFAALCSAGMTVAMRRLSAARTRPETSFGRKKTPLAGSAISISPGAKTLPFHNLLIGKIRDADFGADDEQSIRRSAYSAVDAGRCGQAWRL